MRFNTLLFLVSFFLTVFAFKTNKDYHKVKVEREILKNQYDSLLNEYLLIKDDCALLEKAMETLEKEDPTIVNRWDLLINGVSSNKR